MPGIRKNGGLESVPAGLLNFAHSYMRVNASFCAFLNYSHTNFFFLRMREFGEASVLVHHHVQLDTVLTIRIVEGPCSPLEAN